MPVAGLDHSTRTPLTHKDRALAAKAADIIRERGWCQASTINSHGEVCLVGAIGLAIGLSDETGIFGVQEVANAQPDLVMAAYHRLCDTEDDFPRRVDDLTPAQALNTIVTWNDYYRFDPEINLMVYRSVDEVLGLLEALAKEES